MNDSTGAIAYRWLCATSSKHRPWQIAAAVACGALAGLCLVNSPLGVLLVAILFLAPIHYVVFAGVAVSVALCSFYAAPLLAEVGERSLSTREAISIVGRLHTIQGVPWLGLNNTLTHGALLVGLAQFVPTMGISWWFVLGLREHDRFLKETQADTLRARSSEQAEFECEELELFVAHAAQAAEDADEPLGFVPLASDSTKDVQAHHASGSIDHEMHLSQSSTSLLSHPYTSERADDRQLAGSPNVEARQIDEQLEQTIKLALDPESNVKAEDVARRAAQLVSLVDGMLVALEDKNVRTDGPVAKQADSAFSNSYAQNDAMQSPATGMLSERDVERIGHARDYAREVRSETDAGKSFEQVKQHAAHTGVEQPKSGNSKDRLSEVAQQEQALRYLLHHLREIKNRV